MGALFLGGCAKGDPPPAAPTHAHFDQIQRHEARIAEARATAHREMATETPACTQACEARDVAAREAEALCTLAGGVDDADAQARCRDARASAVEVETRVTAGCDCDEGGAP